MSPRRLALPIFAALTLAACNTVDAPAEAPAAIATMAMPAPIPDHDWFYAEHEGDEAGLSFGVDETDNVWLALSCRRSAGRVTASVVAGDDEPHEIRVEAAGRSAVWPATAEEMDDDLYDGVFLSADLPGDDPVLAGFRSSRWMSLIDTGGARHPMAPHPGSAARIEQFFVFCG